MNTPFTLLNGIERIMVLGDSHGALGFVTQALEFAAKTDCQMLHVVGDFGYWTHVEDGIRFLDEVNAVAELLGILVTWTDGNHENFDDLYKIPVDDDGFRRVREYIWHCPRGHMWRMGKVNFLSMGGAHSIDGPGGVWGPDRGPGNGWWKQESITMDEVETAIRTMMDWANRTPYPDVDVMFTHDAPTSVSLPPSIHGYPAAEENRERLQQVYEAAQPQLLVHGHYHLHQTYHERRIADALCVALAHNRAQGGQYLFIDTDPFKVVVPEW